MEVQAMNFPAHPDIKSALVDLLRQQGGSNFEMGLTDAYEDLADHFNLSTEERHASYEEVTGEGSNTENYWQNAIRTAKARLIDEGVLERSPGRGICKLTAR